MRRLPKPQKNSGEHNLNSWIGRPALTPYRRALPSLNALMTFEAAARHGSFTAAARELGVTQAAVSRQIQVLEQGFGVRLFHRAHRKVETTAAGALLAATLNDCFQRILATADLIRQPETTGTLTVGATLAFSHFWLLPRIADFRAAHPDVAIRIVTQDEPFDLARDDVDVLLHFGLGVPRGGTLVASAPDVVYPVGAPSFAATLTSLATPADLARAPLIANRAADPTWLDWPSWFEAVGSDRIEPRPALFFSSYTDCIQAAVGGQGIALGWHFLLERQLAAGQLVRVGSWHADPTARYQLVTNTRRSGASARAFCAWAAPAFERDGD